MLFTIYNFKSFCFTFVQIYMACLKELQILFLLEYKLEHNAVQTDGSINTGGNSVTERAIR